MATVTVMLKNPMGIIAKVGKTEMQFNGWNTQTGQIIQVAPLERVGQTDDVPAEFWEAWEKENIDHPLVTNGLISAQASVKSAQAEAKERAGVKSGFEALDPRKEAAGVKQDKE